MSVTKTTENQTKKLFLQRIVDGCIVVLISLFILAIYEDAWAIEHTKENMFAIHFDMFSIYYLLAFILFLYVVPNFYEFISNRRILYRYFDEKRVTTKLARFLRIVLISFFIVVLSVLFTDKYSRVEFYNDGSIIEYNKHNQIVNEYNESDIEFVELKTNHSIGKVVTYWTEAVIYVKDNDFILTQGDYIAPDNYEVNIDTERSLYGLSRIKENFPDKIRINTENIDTLLEVEHYFYTQEQAKKLCEIFEVDYEEMMLWLKEEWDIVLESDNE